MRRPDGMTPSRGAGNGAWLGNDAGNVGGTGNDVCDGSGQMARIGAAGALS